MSLPPGVAHDLAPLPTGEVAEGVVSWPAEHRASLPVVVLIAHKTVRVLQLGPPAGVQVLGPLLTHSQVPLGGHGADDAVWVLYTGRRERMRDVELTVPKCVKVCQTDKGVCLFPTCGEVVFGVGV